MMKRSMMRRPFICLLTLILSLSGLNAQISRAEAIQAAKAAGYSTREIEQTISRVKGEKGTGQTDVPPTVVYQPENPVMEEPTDDRAGNEAATTADASTVYGHSLFLNRNIHFTPNFNTPAPATYVLGVNDQLVVEVWGDAENTYRLTIGRDGCVNVPDLGPVYLSGYTLQQAEDILTGKLSQTLGGFTTDRQRTFLKVSLGQLRSISVTVIGNVRTLGTYTLSSMGTICTALYVAGGVAPLGTVRDIRLIRKGKTVAHFDVYDFTEKGDLSANVRLEENDIIKVDPAASVVSIGGAVKRPSSYELKDGETLQELIGLACGFTAEARTEELYMQRVEGTQRKSFNIAAAEYGSLALQNGDSVYVRTNPTLYGNRVFIGGSVLFPGRYALSDKIHSVKTLIEAAGGYAEGAATGYAYLQRWTEERTPESVGVDLKALEAGGDMELRKGDILSIYSLEEMRGSAFVTVSGAVRSPGLFEYRQGMSLNDALLLAKGLDRDATKARVEIARRRENRNSLEYSDSITRIITLNLLENPEALYLPLRPYDHVMVRWSPDVKPAQTVQVTGEVLFPGSQILETDQVRLSDVIKHAGGLLPTANIKAIRLLRQMTDGEYAVAVKAQRKAAEKLMDGKDSIRTAAPERTFPVSVDVEQALAGPHGPKDLLLRENDVVNIPRMENIVRITGAVMAENAATYNPDYSWKDYIKNEAGGYTDKARPRKVFVILPNGSVARRGSKNFHIEPGCEIVVPEKVEDRQKMSVGERVSMMSGISSVTSVVISLVYLLSK